MPCRSMYIELTGIFKQITCWRTSINFKYLQQDQVWYYMQKSHETGTKVAKASQPLCSRPLAHKSNWTRILPIPSSFQTDRGSSVFDDLTVFLHLQNSGSCFAGHRVLPPVYHTVQTLKCTLKRRVIVETPQKPLD